MVKKRLETVVPERRFPAFVGTPGWLPKTLGESGTFVRGLTYSADDVQDDGLLVLRSANIQNGSLVLDQDLVFVGKDCPPELDLLPGDLAICMSNGSKALVGKSAEFKGDYAGKLTVGAFCSIYRTTIPFVKIAFRTGLYADFVASAIAGGNINNLRNNQLEAFEFAVPSSKAEQRKLGAFLDSIDSLIASQKQRCAALLLHRQGLMQELFPREDELVPRTRFPEFVGGAPWSSETLGEMVAEKLRPVQMEDDAEYSLVTVKRRYGGVVGRERLTGRAIKVKSQYTVKENDFLISKRQIVHNACGLVPRDMSGAIVSNEYAIFVPRKNCDIEFFNYFAQQRVVSASFLRASVGIVIEKMLFKVGTWLGFKFPFPPLAEQRKIAKIMRSIDALIQIESEKLSGLESYREGFMQQMFETPMVRS